MNRRNLIKSLAGAVAATVAPVPAASKPMSIGVDMAKDHALDAMLCYVMVQNSKTGVVGMYSYKVTADNRVRITQKATS